MGTQGTGKGLPGDVVLDAGALIAFERGDELVKGVLRNAIALRSRVFIPASALAQVWRGDPSAAPLTRLIGASEVDPLEGRRAREVGQRLGERNASDVVDAHVACCATEFRAAIATSDARDMQALALPGERLTLISV